MGWSLYGVFVDEFMLDMHRFSQYVSCCGNPSFTLEMIVIPEACDPSSNITISESCIRVWIWMLIDSEHRKVSPVSFIVPIS
jgi:hypothetical protein